MTFAQVDKEFWFAAPYINDEGRDFDKPVGLKITTLSAPATVVISMPANLSFIPITQTVAANSTISVDLTTWLTLLQNTPANTVLNKGLLITSTADITVYYENISSDCDCDPEIFSLKGKNALGKEFFISSQYSYDESPYYAAANSFDIVATQNNTHITITPTKDIVGHSANVAFTITLNAGQTYSAVSTSSSAAAHLQGSYISADNPVAVTLKDDLVQVSSCADLIGDQTVPTNVLGTEYIVTKGYLSTDDNVYVLAIADGTSVYRDGNSTAVAVLAKGESTTLNLSNLSTYIHSNNNIYVYHLTGNGCEVGSAIIPKLSCTGSRSVSIVRSKPELFAVLITTKNGNQNNFSVNGDKTLITSSDFSPVPGTGGAYVTSRIDLSAKTSVGNAINFSNSSGEFSLGFINGGSNSGTSYGFFSSFESSSVEYSSLAICQGGSVQLSAYGGVSYQWIPNIGLDNPRVANPVASPKVATTYKVFITTADGCVDTASVIVSILKPRIVDTTVSLCSGGSYKLPSGKTVSTAGTYLDKASYKAGCDSLITTLHLNVGITTPLVSISTPTNNVCSGTLISFTATPINEGAVPIYQWQVNGQNAGTNNATFSSNTLSNNDMVTCTLTSNANCATPATVQSNTIITIIKPVITPTVKIITSQNGVCEGTSVTFNAQSVNGGIHPVYQWMLNGVKAGTDSPLFDGSNFSNGDQITCILTSDIQCAVPATSNTIVLNVNPFQTPGVSITASNNNICSGTAIQFTANVTNAGTNADYQWLLNGVKKGANSATFIGSDFINGDIVSCVVTSKATCSTEPTAQSNSITVNVQGSVTPVIVVAASANNVCEGIQITFTATATNGGDLPAYLWFVNGIDQNISSDTFTSSALINNDVVTCALTSNANCVMPLTVKSNVIAVVINKPPVVTTGGDKTIELGSSSMLSASATGTIAAVTWTPSTGLDNSKILTPTASPDETTLYTVTVQSTDGCIGVGTVTVKVLKDITIPNSFSPNGDGVNDKWEIKNLAEYGNSYVKIFNRWGQQVFQSRGYSTPWDGTYNGKKLPFGAYYYVIKLNNNTRPLSGYITLLQ